MNLERVGPYCIEKLLGSGGMGAVYLAWDERLKRKVAIKFIPHSNQISDENRERLRREARIVAGLVHPALAQVYDIVFEDDREFIVMEYVVGVSLSTIFVNGRLDIDRALHLSRQIADGLKVAHDAGIVHRDLKAENIMITADDAVKILDFGVAKRIHADASEESLTQEGVVMGTTRAMSPEQAEGRRVDQRSDLFSLGSLMYEMVTAVHPFQHSSPLETMQRVVRHKPTPVQDLNRRVPPALVDLINGLLEKDRDKRLSDAGEVSRRIIAIATADAAASAPATPPPAPWWRSRWLPVIGALLLTATIVSIVIFWF